MIIRTWIPSILFCLLAFTLNAQASRAKIDTVQKGYYILPDTTWDAFLVTTFVRDVEVEQKVFGNKLPADVILRIITCDTGSMVKYYELKNNQGDSRSRAPSRQYVIGERNSVPDAVDGKSDTIRITADDLAEIQLDTSVIAFAISIPINGKTTQFGCAGNTIATEHKAFIRSLKPGQRVYFQMLLVRKQDGSTFRIPQLNYLIIQ